jgi:hypothetical protein
VDKLRQRIGQLALLTAALVLLAVCLSLGVAWARMSLQKTMALTLDIDTGEGQAYILSGARDETGALLRTEEGAFQKPEPGVWGVVLSDPEDPESAAELLYLEFLLANTDRPGSYPAADLEVWTELYVTSGILDPRQLTVTLLTESGSYAGTLLPEPEGSELYGRYGAGYRCRFLNAGGDVLTWPLVGGKLSAQAMRLEVRGEAAVASALTLLAAAVPG